jgi:hypothetical protein
MFGSYHPDPCNGGEAKTLHTVKKATTSDILLYLSVKQLSGAESKYAYKL